MTNNLTNNETDISLDETLNSFDVVDKSLLSDEILEQQIIKENEIYVKNLPYHTRLNPPKKEVFKSDRPSAVFEAPYEIKSPQDALKAFGMSSRDDSMFPNNKLQPTYGDFTKFNNFESQLELVRSCREQFDSLPSEIREKFKNKIENFAKYVSSSEFDPEYIMTDEFRKNTYYKHLEALKDEADFQAMSKAEKYSKLKEFREKKKELQ